MPAVVLNDFPVLVALIVKLPERSSAIQSSAAVGGPELSAPPLPVVDHVVESVQFPPAALR